MILIAIDGSLCTASVCHKYKVVFCKNNSLFYAIHLTLDFALGCRRLSFMVSSIITANDGGRTTDENLSSWAPSATCNSN